MKTEIIDFPLHRRISGKLNNKVLEMRLGNTLICKRPMGQKLTMTEYISTGNEAIDSVIHKAADQYINRRIIWVN